MSTKVIELANAGLDELKSGKVKHFDWQIRREIYKILNSKAISTPSPQHKHLVIQSVDFVMPFFTLVNKNDQLAFKLLECAKAVSENRITDLQELDEIQDDGYYNQWFGFNYETKQWDFRSMYIGDATYRALVEVRYKTDPWEGIEHLSKGNGVFRFGSTEHTDWKSSKEFTDEDWKTGPFGDTAVLAAFAYSTSPTVDEQQPKLLYEFWEWWVQIALPNVLKIKSA